MCLRFVSPTSCLSTPPLGRPRLPRIVAVSSWVFGLLCFSGGSARARSREAAISHTGVCCLETAPGVWTACHAVRTLQNHASSSSSPAGRARFLFGTLLAMGGLTDSSWMVSPLSPTEMMERIPSEYILWESTGSSNLKICPIEDPEVWDGSTCPWCLSGDYLVDPEHEMCGHCTCGPGLERGSDASDPMLCNLCEAGQFQARSTGHTCSACPLGYFAANAGATRCETCEVGWFAQDSITSWAITNGFAGNLCEPRSIFNVQILNSLLPVLGFFPGDAVHLALP